MADPFEEWTRRRFLASALKTAGALTLGASFALPARPARADIEPATITEIYEGARGVTFYLEMAHGPFPHRHAPYTDATTIVYVPYHYRLPVDERIDTVLHFHGHRTTAREAMVDHELREQLLDSLQNAVLVIPQLAVNAEDSDGGKLDEPEGLLDFLTEVRKTLQTREVTDAVGDAAVTRSARIGALCMSAHSGGYRVAARCIEVGEYNVNELYLFDALYGEVSTFRDWILERADQSNSRERHKLVSFYNDDSDEIGRNNRRLMRYLEENGIDYVLEEPDHLITRGEMTRSRVVFIRARQSHSGLTYSQNNLRDCLYASCLHRRIDSDWFDDTESEREIEARDAP